MNQPLSQPGKLLVTTFGLGFCHPASGTWGSLPPIVLAAAMLAAGLPAEGWTFGLVMAVLVGLFGGACVRFGDQAASAFGRSDPSQVVADETAGMALVLAFLPEGVTTTPALAVTTLLLAFVAFRLLDIFKPWPADKLEGVAGGWGVLLDDLAVAVYAIIAMHVAALVVDLPAL